MPDLPAPDPHVIALCIADLHLWQTPPIARSTEKNWLETQAKYLRQVGRLQNRIAKNQNNSEPSLIIAGDFFDKFNPSPELLNMVLENLPRCYGIVGQHDLPHHRLEDIGKTGYWTLVKAGIVVDLSVGVEYWQVSGGGATTLELWGFPWGVTPHPPTENPVSKSLTVQIAVVHDTLWTKTTGYPGAPEEKRVANRMDQFRGYDFVVSGDNHKHFEIPAKNGNPCFWNCGAAVRRKQDERKYFPTVGMLMSDGTVGGYTLDVGDDKFTELDDNIAESVAGVDASDFIYELQKLGDSAINFGQRMRQFLEKYCNDPEVRELVEGAMQKRRKK